MGSTPDLDFGIFHFSMRLELMHVWTAKRKPHRRLLSCRRFSFNFQVSGLNFQVSSFKFQFPSFNFQGRELPHLLEKFGDLVPQTTWETRNQLLQIIYGYGLARLQTQW